MFSKNWLGLETECISWFEQDYTDLVLKSSQLKLRVVVGSSSHLVRVITLRTLVQVIVSGIPT